MWIFIIFAIYQNNKKKPVSNYCKHYPGQTSHEGNRLLSEVKMYDLLFIY